MKVIKRDGREVEYDRNKIAIAIEKANEGVDPGERISEEKVFRQALRDNLDKYGFIVSNIKKNAVDEKQVYTLYYDKREMIKYIPSHRILAINRGENEDVLKKENIKFKRIQCFQ